MNPYEMDTGYPDSLSSSPRSRETDSEQRWDAADSTGGSRVRLMCSYGGKILPRPHDNQLSYVGGDTRILAVDRNIRFSSMIGKLSNIWGSSVSFKYQLPNEDLDALVSVTNDEDMENMMAEYDRLQKMGYRFSRLRLFVFANKPDGASSQGSMGSLMEETKRENWFVDALNVGPVSRSETVPQGGPWMNNMPDYLFGLEGNAVDNDRSSAQRNFVPDQPNSKAGQDLYPGRDSQQPPEVQSAPNSPIIGYSSVDSIASAPARINTAVAQQQQGSDQAESGVGVNLGRGFEQESNLRVNASSKPIDSAPVPEAVPFLKTADRAASANIQKQEQYTSERPPQQQVPTQEFQKLQLRQQPQDPIARPVDENPNPNIQGRRIYSDPVRAANLPNQEMTRPNPVDPAYMPQQQQIQQNPSPPEYFIQEQGSHFVPQSYWQMQEPHGDQQYHPVYFVHAGSHMPMSAVRPMGQPVPMPATGGSYYNHMQRMPSPVQVYSSEAAPLSNPVTTVRAGPTVLRQSAPDPAEPYREPIPIPAPVPKGPYAPAPVVGDARVMYRPAMPVPLGHTDPYSYQNVMYEQGSRQVYYTQASPAMNPQYQSTAASPAMNPQYQPTAASPAMNPQYQSTAVGPVTAVELQASSAEMTSSDQPKLARISPPSS